MIAALAQAGGIRALYPFAPDQIQPASLDLRLGSIAYRVRASFLPGPGTTVDQRIAELKLHEFSLVDGAVLETGCVYIVPLIERLALPPDIAAATNPKSSTGRLDVFTRVIADETRGFDRVAGGAVAVALAPRRRRPQRRSAAAAACARASGRSRRGGAGRRHRGEHRSRRQQRAQ
jgi:dCTP deaminase